MDRAQGEAKDGQQGRRNMALAVGALLGQVGCLTLVVILVALVAGLWLDRQLDTRPLFTVLLMLGSVPVTIFLMIRVVLAGASKFEEMTGPITPSTQEEERFERNE